MTAAPAIVVLGCKAELDRGRLVGALGRRVSAAAECARRASDGLVVAAGGRLWAGRAEADWMRDALVAAGVAPARIVRELVSLDTFENAREAARLLRARGVGEVALVTCAWHLARARSAFEGQGLVVAEACPVPAPPAGPAVVGWRFGRERVARWLDGRRLRRVTAHGRGTAS